MDKNFSGSPILKFIVLVLPDIAFTFLVKIYSSGIPVSVSTEETSGVISADELILKSTISKVSKINEVSFDEATDMPLSMVIQKVEE